MGIVNPGQPKVFSKQKESYHQSMLSKRWLWRKSDSVTQITYEAMKGRENAKHDRSISVLQHVLGINVEIRYKLVPFTTKNCVEWRPNKPVWRE